MAGLASKVHHRLQLAYRPNTTTNYMGHFKTFMSYCVFYHINLQELREIHLLGFLEFLAHSGLSHFTISNYLAGLRAMFHRFSLPVTLLHSKNISLILQSFSKSLKYSPKPKGVFNIQQLLAIIQLTEKFPHSRIFKAIFLLAFHGFFRLSNLVPVTSASFDPVRHLTSSDLIWAPPGVHVLLKWSKTIQSVSQYKTIPLAQIKKFTFVSCISTPGNVRLLYGSKKCSFIFLQKFKLIGGYYTISSTVNFGFNFKISQPSFTPLWVPHF